MIENIFTYILTTRILNRPAIFNQVDNNHKMTETQQQQKKATDR